MRCLIIIFIIISHSVIGQTYSVNWSELSRTKGKMVKLLPRNEGEYFALRWVGGQVLGSYQASLYRNFQLISSNRIRVQARNSVANFESAGVVDDKFVVFLSDKSDGQNHLYMQLYNDSLERDGESLKLASYALDRERNQGSFSLKLSENEKYLGVTWVIPEKKNSRDLYGFKIYNMNFELVNEGEYPLPFDEHLSTIHSYHISNNGDFFMAVTEYEEDNESGLFRDKIAYKALHIFHIAEDGLMDYQLDLEGRRVEAMAMSSDDNDIFTITGLYGNSDEDGVNGAFYQRLDVIKGEKVQEEFKEFDKEFITEGWSDRAIERAERRSERGKGDPQLYHYIIKDIKSTSAGSTIVTMEQYYIQVRSYPDSRGIQTSSSYYYYYNDVILYKIDSSGSFAWLEKVRKYQVSTNDEGPFSSYQSFIDSGKLYLLFNDNALHYDENGDYVEPEELNTADYGKRRNAVAVAEINLDTGEQKRKTFFDRSEIEAIAVPKLFSLNDRVGELLLYAVWGRKEKIGILKLGD